jgi:hypothetical protein
MKTEYISEMVRVILAVLIFAIPISATAGCCHRHHYHHWHYSYPGDQVNRGDVYRNGPPELGGYRGGYYSRHYHDNTTYDDD